MKRVATVASAVLLASTSVFVATASAQETTTTTTEAPTTTVESTTTTAAPETTTTTAAPETTTTTVAPAPDPVPVDLPGAHVTAGTLQFDMRFTDSPAASCTKTLDLAGGQVNVANDESGNIGGVYGLVPSGGGNTGVFMVGLGAVPAGVAIISVSDPDCEFDAVGIGSYASDSGWARINGVGAGLHPGYETPDYVNMFMIDAKVSASTPGAVLDMDYVKQFLLRNRPGLTLPQG